MWVPDIYRITDTTVIERFIAETGLGSLVTADGGYPIATHTPMELERDDQGDHILLGHIAKANPQSQHLVNGVPALAIFLSPINHYITSSWYEKPNAPTWNYLAVHISGPVKILSGQALWDAVDRLVAHHERDNNEPVTLHGLPKRIQAMLQEVTGFQITVDRMEASFKLSQNRNRKDYDHIIQGLEEIGTPLAKAMAETLYKRRKKS